MNSTSYCEHCTAKVALVRNVNRMVCPRCHGSGAKGSMRTAQFGGVGGGQSPWAPGGSPIGRGGVGGGHGVNNPHYDEGLDSIMGRTRMEREYDTDDNMEKELEPFHDYIEKDRIPYELTAEQRKKLRIKEQIERRERYMRDAADSIEQNSVDYIKKHFHAAPQHMQGMDATLQARRTNTDKPHERENHLPEPIKPERIHPILSMTGQFVKIAGPNTFHGRTTPFSNDVQEEDEPTNNLRKQQFTPIPAAGFVGSIPQTGLEVDEDLAGKNEADARYNMMDDDTMISYPNDDPHVYNPPRPSLGSPVPSSEKQVDPQKGMESNLVALRHEKPQRLPHDIYPEMNWNKIRGDKGINSHYPFSPDSGYFPLLSLGG